MAKHWLSYAATVVAAGILAWGPERPQTSLRSGRTPVIFWHMWNEKEWRDVVEDIAHRFNESQSEYEVIPLPVPPEDAEIKFLLAGAGGDPPDLVSQWMPVLGIWSDRKLIQPVEDQMTPAERTKYLAEAYPIIKRHAIYKDKIMAIVAGVDVHAVYYRLDDLKEVGRDKEHLPKTLEELTQLARQLDRRDKDGKLNRAGFLPGNYELLAPSFGDTPADATTFDALLPANLAALDYISAQDKQIGFDNVTRFLSSQPADVGINAPILTGNYSMVLDGQWRIKQIDTYASNLNYAVGPLPPPAGGRPNASYTNADLLLIPAGAKHARGAWEFMKFWIGFDHPEQGSVNVANMGWLPYCQQVANSAGYQAYLKKYPKFRAFLDMMSSPNLAIPPQGPLEAYIVDQMRQANDAVNHGTSSPPAALEAMNASIRRETARQKRLGHGE